MTRMRKYAPAAFGAAVAVCLFIGLQLFSYVRFENSDDILIVKSFMGFEGGVPARFNLYLHTLTAQFLGWISTVAPGAPWFSLLQLFCLWLSLAVVAKSAAKCGAGKSMPLSWAGMALGLLFAGVIGAFACARVNFTTTAALLGAAAVAQLTTLADPERPAPAGAAFSVLLLLGCYLIRPQSFVAALPFWGLALAWLLCVRGAGRTRPLPRSFFAVLLAGAACLCLLAGIRYIELQDPLLKELDAFQTANLSPMDYDEGMLEAVPDSVLAEIGWSRAELELVRQWYFMDENITADAFTRLNAAMSRETGLGERAAGAVRTVAGFYRGNARYLTSALLLLALGSLCFALPGAVSSVAGVSSLGDQHEGGNGCHGDGHGRKAAPLQRLATPLAVALCLLGTAAMLLYLAYGGRFLARAADCALFPATAFLCCLAAHCLRGLALTDGKRADGFGAGISMPRRWIALLLCALALGAGAVNLLETRKALSDRPDAVSATRESDLEAFALEHPEQLILRTPDLLRDTRILPDVSGGIPANIMIWGDWYCRTPSWYGQLERFGIDGRRFTGADFLRDNLLFVTAEAAPPPALLAYIAEAAKSAVQAELYGAKGDLLFFRFVAR